MSLLAKKKKKKNNFCVTIPIKGCSSFKYCMPGDMKVSHYFVFGCNRTFHLFQGFNVCPNFLMSRKSFLKCVNPLEADTTTSEARLTMWEEINNSLPPSTTMGFVASEQLPPGADESWAKWKCLNRLRTGVGRAKVTLSKWGI